MTSPDRNVPEGAVQISSLSELQAYTEDGVRQRLEAPLRDTLDNVREALSDGLLGSIGDIFRGNTPRLPDLGFLRDAWSDGQEAVTDLWRRLSPLEEYAAAYMSTASGLWQGGKVTFDRMLVGSKGVTHEAGGFTLHDHGMWKIDAQIWPDIWVTDAGNTVDYEIRVINPSGGVYHRKRFRHSSSVAFSAPLSTSVVVPEAGYRVEVHVTNIVVGRSLLGGSDRTHLFVHHINRVVPGPGDNTGQN